MLKPENDTDRRSAILLRNDDVIAVARRLIRLAKKRFVCCAAAPLGICIKKGEQQNSNEKQCDSLHFNGVSENFMIERTKTSSHLERERYNQYYQSEKNNI